MKAIMVMFDSLNRRMLPNYGCDWTIAPNFEKLKEKTITFTNFFAGSLPCMPARRDLHTGRYNFLHRTWGPIEPFDDSMPEILKNNGIFTKLISDHDHYWEDGGSTYHSRYSTWETVRGQEADPWSSDSEDPQIPDHVPVMREATHPDWWIDSFKNKEIIHETNVWPQNKVFDKGLEFLEINKDKDNWFVQIETFDPHEPFDSPDEFCELYDDSYEGKYFDWPSYAPVTETKDEVEHIRKKYAALLSMCDRNLGRITKFMDDNDMWKDTMLIVNTDHGYMLGEKDWWAKAVMPCYNEIANTPFFLWNPKLGIKNESRSSLAQSIDIPATLLNYFDVEIPEDMQGKALDPVIEDRADNTKVREYGLFGFHGSFINVTDGKYLYMRSAASASNEPLNEYTLMPTRQRGFFGTEELSQMDVAKPFEFTKNSNVMKIPNPSRLKHATFCNSFQYGHMLFDLESDPEQLNPVDNPTVEARMTNALIVCMKENDTPSEQFERVGLNPDLQYTEEKILEDRSGRIGFENYPITADYKWSTDARNIFLGLLALVPVNKVEEYLNSIKTTMERYGSKKVERKHFVDIAKIFYSDDEQKIFYFLNKLSRIR